VLNRLQKCFAIQSRFLKLGKCEFDESNRPCHFAIVFRGIRQVNKQAKQEAREDMMQSSSALNPSFIESWDPFRQQVHDEWYIACREHDGMHRRNAYRLRIADVTKAIKQNPNGTHIPVVRPPH